MAWGFLFFSIYALKHIVNEMDNVVLMEAAFLLIATNKASSESCEAAYFDFMFDVHYICS